MARRAIGIIRVSQPHGREGERFASPKDQRAAIERVCAEQGFVLADAHEEMKVSGNALLEDRPGLSQAVAAVLAGSADVIVADTTERLWWNHETRAQVLRLVADAGGEVWSADQGRLTNGTAADEFTGTVRTAADKLSRDQNAEKSRRAVIRAVDRGVVPWAGSIPGYLRGDDGQLIPDPVLAPVVAQAFEMRGDGATINEVRAFLRANGVQRSYHGVQSLLRSPLVIGEVRFGKLKNLSAHPAIVDRELWKRVQLTRVSRGRRAKSDRLLARVGVLRCANCGARMIVGTQTQRGRRYPFYRCPPVGDCQQRVTIGAEMVERVVVEKVREVLADAEGRASMEQEAREADAAAEKAQADLDAAIRAFAGLDGETAAAERLVELRDIRDRAVEHAGQLGGRRVGRLVRVGADWDRLSLDGRRALIRAVVARVLVGKGRGVERVTVELRPAIELLGE